MYYNNATIVLSADENFVSYSSIDGYVYFDPILGYGFTYADILSGGTFLGLSSLPPISGLSPSLYTNTSTFLSSNNLTIRRQTFGGYIFTAPVKINFSLQNVAQSIYKIEKISASLNGSIQDANKNFLDSSILNSITGTYETNSVFSTTYSESISCFRENYYVDIFDVNFTLVQPSILDIPAKYKIINIQLLDDNQTYLLTLEGYEDKDIHYSVLASETTLFEKSTGLQIEYPSLNPLIT